MFTRIGIVSKLHEPAVKDAIESVIRVLNERGCEVCLSSESIPLDIRGDYTTSANSDLPEHCDLVISIGGDGTLLQCAGLIYPRDVALLGINLGRLGFLTDLPPEDIETGLNAVLDGSFISEERAVLGCEICCRRCCC